MEEIDEAKELKVFITSMSVLCTFNILLHQINLGREIMKDKEIRHKRIQHISLNWKSQAAKVGCKHLHKLMSILGFDGKDTMFFRTIKKIISATFAISGKCLAPEGRLRVIILMHNQYSSLVSDLCWKEKIGVQNSVLGNSIMTVYVHKFLGF